MVFSKKGAVVLVTLFCLAVLSTADYFAGLPIDQNLANRANMAMNRLKEKLEETIDCSDAGPSRNIQNNLWQSGQQNGARISTYSWSSGGCQHQSQSFFRGQFKKNRDRASFQFRFPTLKRLGLTISLLDRQELYRRLREVSDILEQIKRALINYNNVIIGQKNKVDGNNNVVVGSRNNLQGDNYWVFESDYNSSSSEDGVLIIRNYIIELTDIPSILSKPDEVIRCMRQKDSNSRFQTWWNTARQHFKLCI